MSNAANVPPPPNQPEKKGLSPLAWVGIGCLGVLVVGGIVAMILGVFVVGKVRDVAREMEEDPIATTARFMAAANPDIELVEADKESRTVTFRDTQSGEEFTVGYDELEEGRVTFSSGGETATLEVGTAGDETGQVTIRGADGTTHFRAGGPIEDVPEWVPRFPGATPEGTFSSEADATRTGAFSFVTTEELSAVLAHYEREAQENGLSVDSRTTTPTNAMIVAGAPDGSRGLSVVATRKDDASVEVLVNYTETR